MKVIFLDIDGVLATETTYNIWARDSWTKHFPTKPIPQGRSWKAWRNECTRITKVNEHLLDANCCANVQAVCDQTGAKLILSSSWRHFIGLPELSTLLALKGLTSPLIDKTTILGFHRGQQIKEKVEALGLAKTDIAVFEDEEDVDPFNGRLVQTSFNGSNAGFRAKHLRRAIKLLGD